MNSKSNRAATEKAAAKLARIQELLREAKAQEQTALDRQALIVGRAVIDELRISPQFKKSVGEVLRRTITKPAARAEISALLIEVTTP